MGTKITLVVKVPNYTVTHCGTLDDPHSSVCGLHDHVYHYCSIFCHDTHRSENCCPTCKQSIPRSQKCIDAAKATGATKGKAKITVTVEVPESTKDCNHSEDRLCEHFDGDHCVCNIFGCEGDNNRSRKCIKLAKEAESATAG